MANSNALNNKQCNTTRLTTGSTNNNNNNSNNSQLLMYEYESSFNMSISRKVFEALINRKPRRRHGQINVGLVRKEVIYYYGTGERFSGGRFERKTSSRSCILRFYRFADKIYYFPLVRKVSTEALSRRPLNEVPETLIVRYVVAEGRFFQDAVKYRICAEKVAHNGGGTYSFTGEIEYPENVYMYHASLNVAETKFMRFVYEAFQEVLDSIDTDIMFDTLSTDKLLKISSRKFSPIYTDLSGKIKRVKLKFDGYKGRLVNNGRRILYYDDMHVMVDIPVEMEQPYTKKTIRPYYFEPHIIYQYEVMPPLAGRDYRTLILTDVLGASYQNKMFHMEPMDVLDYFEYLNYMYMLNRRFPKDGVYLNLPFGRFRLRTQYQVAPSLLQSSDQLQLLEDEGIDGFIIVCGNKEIKYKIPTLDAKCKFLNPVTNIDKHTPVFMIENRIALYVPPDNLKSRQYIEDSIYELAPDPTKYKIEDNLTSVPYARIPDKDGEEKIQAFQVLRHRLDRITSSSYSEYVELVRTTTYIRQLFQ